MTNEKNPTWFEKIVMIVIVLGPVLNIYASPLSMSLYGFISAILSVIYFVLFMLKGRTQKGRVFWYGLGLYFLYRGVNTIVFGILPISIVEQFLGFFMAYGCFNKSYYIKYMKTFAVIAIVFFFVQYFGYLVTGKRISGILSFVPMNYGYDNIAFQYKQALVGRFCSFFSEPSHFAQFLIPLLAIELFYDKTKRHVLFAIIIFITILLMQSGTGFVCLIPIALSIMPYYKRAGMTSTQRILSIFGIGLVIVGALYFAISSGISDYVETRSLELNSQYEVGVGASGFLRIWRGYYVFQDYNILEKLFGVSDPAIILYHIKNSGMYWGIVAEMYFNTIQDVLLFTGFVGLIMFTVVIVHIWRGNNVCGKAILGTLIVISLVEHCFFSNVMLVHLLLAESMKIDNMKAHGQLQ